MKGIQFVVDAKGRKTAVIIDLKTHGGLWQDFYDMVVACNRETDPRESLKSITRRARAIAATEAMQDQAVATDKHRMSKAAIESKINVYRKSRARHSR